MLHKISFCIIYKLIIFSTTNFISFFSNGLCYLQLEMQANYGRLHTNIYFIIVNVIFAARFECIELKPVLYCLKVLYH